MLSNFKDDFEKNKKLVKEVEINEFPITIQQLLKHSDIFKVDADKEYNIDELCVKAIEDLTRTLYSIDSPSNSIFQLTRSDYCEVRTIKYIIENIDEFWNYIYKLNKDQKRVLTKSAKYYAYRGNLSEDICSMARDLYSECIKFSSEEADKFIAGALTEKEILTIKKRTLNFLKPNYPLCRKKIIDNRVKIIINGAKFLDRYGYMDYYVNINNTRARRLNMSYLETNTRTSKKEKPFTCISDYYDSDILSSLPDEELSALSLFMVNRVEKVKSKVIKALVMITFLSDETKNNIDNARTLNINEIPKSEIIEAATRYRMLNSHLIEQRRIHNDDGLPDYDKNLGYINNDNLGYREANIAEGISTEFMNAYNDEYNRYDGDNMLFEDLTRLVSSDNFQIFYEYKDSLIDILLNSVISARININWGIIPNDMYGFVDENNQIILAFDLPGYNAPISCHANLNKVIETIVNLTNNTIIPLYLGNEQLVYEYNFTDKHYSTYIPFKLSKEQKEAVKEDSMNGNNSIAKHIAMMQNVLSTTKLKREENRFVDLLSFTEDIKVNPSVKSYK